MKMSVCPLWFKSSYIFRPQDASAQLHAAGEPVPAGSFQSHAQL